jgi:hypothetical protein
MTCPLTAAPPNAAGLSHHQQSDGPNTTAQGGHPACRPRASHTSHQPAASAYGQPAPAHPSGLPVPGHADSRRPPTQHPATERSLCTVITSRMVLASDTQLRRLRARSPSSCITQRNAAYRRSPLPAVDSLRHDWSEVAGHQVMSRGRSGLVRPDSGAAAVRSAGSSSTTKGWQCGPGLQPPAWARVIPAAAQEASDGLRRALPLHPPVHGDSCFRVHDRFDSPVYRHRGRSDNLNHCQGGRTRSLAAVSPTAPAATTTMPGTKSFAPGRATLTAPGTSASAPAVIAAWVSVRCSHSIASTGMFNAHHTRARLSCHQEPIHAAQCQLQAPRTTVR